MPPATMRRLVAWLAIAALAVYLVFIGGGWLGIYRSDLRMLTVALAGVVLGAWGAIAWRDPAWRPRSALVPALAACLGSLALSTVFSREPRISLEYVGYAVLLVALYLLLVRLLSDPFFRPRILALGALLFVALVVEFVGGVVLLWIQWWAIAGEIVRPPLRPYFIGLSYGNPSAVLTLVTLLAIPAAILATRIRRPRLALATLVAIVVAIGIVAILSGSRAGWLALAVAFGAVGLAWLVVGDGQAMVGRAATRITERTVPRAWLAAAVIVVGGAAVAALAFAPSILRRVGAGGEDLRSIFLVTALRLFGESPIVGTGPGTWVTERIAATNAGEVDYYVPHAHDVPAQTLAELGVVGAVAGALLLASVAWLVWRAIRSESTERRWLGYLTAIGLVYFSIHNVLDFYANMPAALFAVALPIAYLDATTDETTTAFGRVRAWLERPGLHVLGLWVLSGACVLAVAGLLVHEASAAAGDRAVAAADTGVWLTAFEQASLAAGQDPDIHAYALTAGLAAAHVGDEETAARYLRIVAEQDDLPEAWVDLAGIEAELGHTDAALEAARAALRLGSQRTPIAMAAGGVLLGLGADDEARSAFAAAVASRPSLAGDPWWLTPEVAAVVPSIEDLAIPVAAPEARWEIALMAGDDGQAATLASEPGVQELAREVVTAWTDTAAAGELLSGCRADPSDLDRLRWCARIAAHEGDANLADHLRALSEGISPGSSELGAELRVDEGNDHRVPTTQVATYWGLYTYRRPTPAELLVPGVIHLVLT